MLTGAVLSGGFSSRFGRDKGLVRLGPDPMVLHVVRTLEKVADEVVVAVAAGRSAEYARRIGDMASIVEDGGEARGPLQGLVTALEAARGDYVLVCPCDTPLIRAEVCRTVADRSYDRDGAVPVVRGYQEPLHASYRKGPCLRAFRSTLESGVRKVKDSYHLLDLVPVDESVLRKADADLVSFVNVNSVDDLRRAEKMLEDRSTPALAPVQE